MRTVFTCTIHAEYTRNEFYRTLSIHGTNFIAFWANAEPISSHAEHPRKCLKVEYLSRIEYHFQKSRIAGPWDHMVSVSAKKVKKNFMLVYLYYLIITNNKRPKNYSYYYWCDCVKLSCWGIKKIWVTLTLVLLCGDGGKWFATFCEDGVPLNRILKDCRNSRRPESGRFNQ